MYRLQRSHFACSRARIAKVTLCLFTTHNRNRAMAAAAIRSTLAVVTGTTRGIGVEIARALLKERGLHVIGTGRSEAAGLEAARELGADRFSFVKCDITSDDDVKHLAAAVEARSKEIGADGLRILVNNAGLAFKVGIST